MQELFEKLKKPMIVLAVIIGGYIVYVTFVQSPTTSTSLLKKSSVSSSTPEDSLLPLLLKIQNVTLDEKLFLDPVFRALVDRTQTIVPESIGKDNPFAGTLTSSVVSGVENLGFSDQTDNPSLTTLPAKTAPAQTVTVPGKTTTPTKTTTSVKTTTTTNPGIKK